MSQLPSRFVPLLAAFATLAGLSAPGVAAAQSRAAEAERRVILERMVEEVGEDYPDVATISPVALRDALPEGDLVLVDVRTEAERRVSTLPGAITSEEFEARLQELAGRTVVAYCTIGRRSSEYVRRMARRGVDMLNLEGSVLAWTHAGGQLVNDGVPTRRLHVYGRRWNLAAAGYQTIW
ncbi:MAG: rhodanese-like domain-containing protein [Gemmatimonadota bacterium]|nr:rhodanese-like domain-containing protein [Gemmatimonadota bacterium]MDE2866733.1 rhodanese-like domain-containing protein [Gemmatimonadota bacterium]